MKKGGVLFAGLLLGLIAVIVIGLWTTGTNERDEETFRSIDSLNSRLDSLNAGADSLKSALGR
jgi:hypothetical protein